MTKKEYQRNVKQVRKNIQESIALVRNAGEKPENVQSSKAKSKRKN